MTRTVSLSAICFLLFLSTGCLVSKKDYVLKSDEADRCASNLAQCVDENSTLKSELSSTQESLTSSEKRGEDLSGQLDAVRGQRDELQARLGTQEAVNEELKEQNARLGDLLKSKEVSQSQIIQETMDINKKLQATNVELREEIVRRDSENKRLVGELNMAQAELQEVKTRKEEELQQLKSTYDELVQGLKSEIEAGEIQIRRMKDRLSVNLVEKILFDSGRADLKSSGIQVLSKVGEELSKIKGKRIQIEGHTDDVPIGGKLKERFATNWELSASRAIAVVHFLQEKVGIDPANLSAGAYGEYQPAASNETLEGQAANRRIEIVLLAPYEQISEAQETTGAE
ncbi:MAG: OmpA family protein [bacterium]|nr:MAG: OmpA family protein [bacterium]